MYSVVWLQRIRTPRRGTWVLTSLSLGLLTDGMGAQYPLNSQVSMVIDGTGAATATRMQWVSINWSYCFCS